MNPGARWNTAAQKAAERYGMFLVMLGGVFEHHLQLPDPGSPQVRHKAMARAMELAIPYLEREIEELGYAIATETFLATASAGGAGARDTTEYTQTLDAGIRIQLNQDIASMSQGLRQAALRGALMSRTRGIPERAAITQLRASATLAPRFFFLDRIGKHWLSQKYIRTIWRQALVAAFNETVMLVMAEEGHTHAVIDHPDASFSHQGTIISLGEEDGHMTWAEARDTVFHPNTNAWLSTGE